jgi:hypothetical protein
MWTEQGPVDRRRGERHPGQVAGLCKMGGGMRGREQAETLVLEIGVRPGDALYEKMVDASMRGWSNWRIAQAYDLSPSLIERLGGPAAGRRTR